MKVDLQTGGIGAYRKKSEASVAKPEAETRAAGVKTDVMDIARGESTITDKKLLSLKAGIHSHVSAATGSARIDALKESVKNGSYHIPTEDLANAILDN